MSSTLRFEVWYSRGSRFMKFNECMIERACKRNSSITVERLPENAAVYGQAGISCAAILVCFAGLS